MRKKIIWISITILLLASAVIIWQIMNKPKKSADICDAMDLERIDGFDELEEQVVVKKDITYNKKYGNSKMDVYMSKENYGTPKPTIFWAHGGAFIAGDIKNIAESCTILAIHVTAVVIMYLNFALETNLIVAFYY